MANENYGNLLAEKIRANADLSKLTDYEKFVLDRGFYYDTEETLKVAYDRAWKSRHGILITEDEFVKEAGKGGSNAFRNGTRKRHVKFMERWQNSRRRVKSQIRMFTVTHITDGAYGSRKPLLPIKKAATSGS